jgi:hypothetical protein
MSMANTIKLSCPKCKNTQEVVVWESLNVSLDPELRNKLVCGEINIFRCESCNSKVLINSPLLYHDMKREYCVQYFPPKKIEDFEFYDGFTIDGKLSGLPTDNYLVAPHIVFDFNEMIRYIQFRDKLFDNYKNVTNTK